MTFLHKLKATLQSKPAKLISSPKRASVAAIFRHSPVIGQEDKVQLLFIRRKVNPKDTWSGHMAFPGGRTKAGEDDLLAAIRETQEEIGITLRENDVLGRMDDRPVYYGKTVATPFVFYLDNTIPFEPVLQETEVANVIWVDLDSIQNAAIQHLEIPTRYIFPSKASEYSALDANLTPLQDKHVRFPCIYLDRPEDHPDDDDTAPRKVHDFVLWGLTYNMVSEIMVAGGAERLPSMSGVVRELREAYFKYKMEEESRSNM
ncbi:Aste57867_19372 [Aphanomyces stellatus]|uniref:Aste57867_19372 protein n=1 Tax=Aphanomyces stellatus TaxID=120398 RepID=A0A485LEB6_9STRA|nr:hypothetical protein As57867_019308 [Aphanomyces stellatus]VFT96086.1 Aste57867_19372 [Aphanomyces stellatus]